MKVKPLHITALLVSAHSVYAADQAGGPKLPGVNYGVHDMSRPKPPAVVTGGALSVKPPSDAVVLFDGSSLDAFNGSWVIKDKVLVAAGKDLFTKESFGAVQLHFEWRLPVEIKANGQSGGNSGVFLMGMYEVQVLQSHNNQTYADGQAGALYGQLPPLVNATAPHGEWQSYDIAFEPPVYTDGKVTTPAKMTVLHNGVVVQNGEALLGPTEHMKLASYPPTHPEKAPLSFQWHGDAMEYRNIWVRPLGSRP